MCPIQKKYHSDHYFYGTNRGENMQTNTQSVENPQITLAHDYVRNTNQNIFLTGKAGTGKTTFLHSLKKEGLKRMVIVAPTGVAAINAGGMTIHSFFQLPFGLWLPGAPRDQNSIRKFSSDKIRTIKSIDLLVIDEISMVRADLLDAIDEVLRRYKNAYEPFGGVQLLMIGDLHQLPPVVKTDEWNLLRNHYTTPYFFGSIALQKTNPVTIELKHIYRQSDATFIGLLNKVRDNQLDQETLDLLNSRHVPNFQPSPDQHYITLTSHNATASEINAGHLKNTTGEVHKFEAVVEGDFPTYAYPTEQTLELKVGAQVMFVKNDMGQDKQFYNGKIGKITRIAEDTITVHCPGDKEAISVFQATWENVKYSLNESTKEVNEQVSGIFRQFPLKLAWAITIHKSQGLTFDRAIIDAQDAFAHGQVYVALSRCRSFEGIVLRSRIGTTAVKTDGVVRDFTHQAEKNAPDEQHLLESKRAYQAWLLKGIFQFPELKNAINRLMRICTEHKQSLGSSTFGFVRNVQLALQDKIWVMADKFGPQLEGYFAEGGMPEENLNLQERLKKAASYFIEQLALIDTELNQVHLETDNKEVRKSAVQYLASAKKEVFLKMRAFELVKNGFEAKDYLVKLTNADLDFAATQATAMASVPKAPRDVPHPELYSQLTAWRTETAELNDVEAYQVLPNKSLRHLVEYLPTDALHLAKINGIGAVKLKQFGGELITLIEQYCNKYQLKPNLMQVALAPDKPAKEKNTKELSLEAFRAGKTIDEIAKERGFVRGTIAGHLAYFITTGEVHIHELMDEEKVALIEEKMTKNPNATGTEIKGMLPEHIGYDEIRAVGNYLKWRSVGGE
jgi:hypothetical protein